MLCATGEYIIGRAARRSTPKSIADGFEVSVDNGIEVARKTGGLLYDSPVVANFPCGGVSCDPHPVMQVKSRMRPGEHALRRLDIHEFPAHKQTQHRPSKRLGEYCDIVQRQRHERAVRPESAIGHQQVEVRVPVGQGALVVAGRGPSSERPR